MVKPSKSDVCSWCEIETLNWIKSEITIEVRYLNPFPVLQHVLVLLILSSRIAEKITWELPEKSHQHYNKQDTLSICRHLISKPLQNTLTVSWNVFYLNYDTSNTVSLQAKEQIWWSVNLASNQKASHWPRSTVSQLQATVWLSTIWTS